MARKKTGLGRGLSALIPMADEGDLESRQGVVEVSIAAVMPNPHQPRSSIDQAQLTELAASIEEHGIIQPLVVSKAAENYQLVAGERRWRAAALAGLTTVPVIIKDVAPAEMLELALVENVQRSDLNALEEAQAYRQLIDEFDLTQDQVARRVGQSRVANSNTLRLLKASLSVQNALLDGQITEGHARALLGLERGEAQDAALKAVVARDLNVRQTEDMVRRYRGGREKRAARSAPSPETLSLQDSFREALGTRVNLIRAGAGGRLVIYFYSEEELDAVFNRIVGDS
jgi:ParB family chromosome partitioning protein